MPSENVPLLRIDLPYQKPNFRGRYEHRPNADRVAGTGGSAQLLPRVCRVFPGTRHSCSALGRTWERVEWTLRIRQPLARRDRVAPKHKHSRNDTRHCWAQSATLVQNVFWSNSVTTSKRLP